jgi:D-alanyl-D-alanine carboxypeptidase
MRRIILLLIACLITIPAIGRPSPKTKNTAALKTALQLKLNEWHKAGNFPGATVGVVLAEGESFGLAVGYSDRDLKTPMRPNDRMLAGSVGKTFAAATALQLVEEGKIRLDEKVEKYLGAEPWFSRLPNAKDITVRHLMNHTSGLVRYEFKPQFAKDLSANPEKVWKPAELVAYLLDEKAPFEAGKGWDYSDTNYIVLGMIIEKVTGRTFYGEANRRLIKPLKLKDTIPQDGPKLKGVVQGYAGPNNPFGGTDAMIHDGRFAINPQFEWTGGGFASTAQDLARWAKMIYEGKAYSADLLPQVLDGVTAPMLGREASYGLGVIIRKTPAGTSYGHSGFFPGYLTEMMYFPDLKVAVAIQVNTSVSRSLGKPMSRVLVEMIEVIRAGLVKLRGREGRSDLRLNSPHTFPFLMLLQTMLQVPWLPSRLCAQRTSLPFPPLPLPRRRFERVGLQILKRLLLSPKPPPHRVSASLPSLPRRQLFSASLPNPSPSLAPQPKISLLPAKHPSQQLTSHYASLHADLRFSRQSTFAV